MKLYRIAILSGVFIAASLVTADRVDGEECNPSTSKFVSPIVLTDATASVAIDGTLCEPIHLLSYVYANGVDHPAGPSETNIQRLIDQDSGTSGTLTVNLPTTGTQCRFQVDAVTDGPIYDPLERTSYQGRLLQVAHGGGDCVEPATTTTTSIVDEPTTTTTEDRFATPAATPVPFVPDFTG